MPRYLFVYHGGGMPETEEAIQQAMQAWGNWFESMGQDVADAGNPVGPSTTVNSDGSVVADGGANPASGYSIVAARDLDDAIAKAKTCPILASGGSVELAETFEP